ncbi:MAG: transporter permease [Sphingobacteriales bacterium]|nr:transporter permease [Sphingobacteriales bacterium]
MTEELTLVDNHPPATQPLYFKSREIEVLVIGGGISTLKTLNQIAGRFSEINLLCAEPVVQELKDGLSFFKNVKFIADSYSLKNLDSFSLIILALDDEQLNDEIYQDVKSKGKLVHVVDDELKSDFLLHRTNHQNFKHTHIDSIGADYVNSSQKIVKEKKHWIKIANWCLFALTFMFIGHALFSYWPLAPAIAVIKDLPIYIDDRFLWMLAAGFLAQLVDGALGMGYGVISTTILLSGGLNPAAISGSIHTAEMFSSGASGYSHYKFGNVNKKLFKNLLIPGVIGSIIGAFLLCTINADYANWVRPILSIYTLLLGFKILSNAFKTTVAPKKVKRVGWLAGAGGFLDSFGGGGWGPLVTSTLISKGKSPRYVIGSVSLTEFFVTFASAVTFFIMLGVSHWQSILGLIVGGLIAAPIAAKLAGKLPVKKMFIGVGIIVILSSIRILYMAAGKLL